MESDQKPGVQEVQEAAPMAPQTDPSAPPTGTEPDVTQEAQAETDPLLTLPENIREIVKKREDDARAKALAEYRAKAGAEGGWMSVLTAEAKEELKRDPSSYYRLKAEAEAYRKIVEGGHTQREPARAEPDLKAEALKRAQSRITPDMTTADFMAVMFEEMDQLTEAKARKIATDVAKDSYSVMSHGQQDAYAKSQPEMQNIAFRAIYEGMAQIAAEHNRKASPYERFVMAKEEWKRLFPNAPVNQQRTAAIAPSAADTRRVASSPTLPATSPREKWLKSEGARHLHED